MSMSLEPGAYPAGGGIPLCVPEIRGNELKYIRECLETNFVSSVGPFVERFERMVADYVGAQHAVATVTGTAALHIALLVAGVRPDDEVLVPALTFIAPANAVRYAGAWPLFMDAEADYWQMDPESVRSFLEEQCQSVGGELRNRRTGRRVSAILPVHVLGHPVNMDPILELAHRFGLVVVEDATEALGAKYRGSMAGHLGHIGCFSFNGNKIVTTGGGGMVVTDKQEWARRAKYLSTQAKDDPLEYVHNEVGYNYRLTNLQAAMGCAQMEQLESYVAAKQRIANEYETALTRVPGLAMPRQAPWASSVFWLYTVLVDAPRFRLSSRELLRRLAAQKIQARPLWQPLHLSPALGDGVSYICPVAERLHEDGISLPCSVGITAFQQHCVIDAVRRIAEIHASS